jgi:hypothetical protein
LRDPTPFSATPFSVTVTSPGALGGPTEIKTNVYVVW